MFLCLFVFNFLPEVRYVHTHTESFKILMAKPSGDGTSVSIVGVEAARAWKAGGPVCTVCHGELSNAKTWFLPFFLQSKVVTTTSV